MRKYRQTDAIVFYSECKVSSRYRKDTNKRARYTKFTLVYFTASAGYLRVIAKIITNEQDTQSLLWCILQRVQGIFEVRTSKIQIY